MKKQFSNSSCKLALEEMQNTLAYSYDGILLTDAKGTILMANEAYIRISELPKDDIIGKNMQHFIDSGYLSRSCALMVLEGKKAITITHTDRPGKTIYVTANPIFDEKGSIKLVVTNVRDVTELHQLREDLEKAQQMEEMYYQQMKSNEGHTFKDGLVAISESMNNVLSLAIKISPVDVTVLILGESGVGKEVISKFIHDHSNRKSGPFVTINCGAIPEQLLESELFGYVGGAFTGASKNGKQGLFEAAEGGTLFLDEIGELPLNLQVKLLRVLETHEMTPVGSTKSIPFDARIIVATNKNLEEMVAAETFRDDLFYRLNVIQIRIPPLRERIADIAPLSMYFLHKFNLQYSQEKRMSHDLLRELEKHRWPGNIRELKNTIERLVVVSNGTYLEICDLEGRRCKNKPQSKPVTVSEIMPLHDAIIEVEKQILQAALQKHSSTRQIADVVEIDQSTVVRKLKKYGLNRTSSQ
ncbi:MAG: sigma 54-interacting transcriptional regulator [Bacillota bacterium]|nr:sigma 54-interacting transcriptional regulator [Bacillota bacterium]